MSPLKRLAGAIVLLLSPVLALADPVGYGSWDDALYKVDLANGHITEVGKFGSTGGVAITDVEGLAFTPDGALYGVSDGVETLIRISTSTGRATVIGSLGLAGQGTGQFNALDFGLAATCDGRLWASSDTTGKLWEVNVNNGSTRLVGNLGAAITGLAAKGTKLYGISIGDGAALYEIDPADASATRIGSLDTPRKFYDGGLDFDANGTLWASLDYNPPPASEPQVLRASDLARVDLSTGKATIVATMDGPNFMEMEGLALSVPAPCATTGGGSANAPVPALSPASLLVLLTLVGVAGVAFGRRR